MPWYEKHRMEWILETLLIFGFINRKHLMRKFGISTPQASSDIAKFKALNPGLIAYDKSKKHYYLPKGPNK